MKTLFAWTEPGGRYPGFVNISTDDDEFIIHLRSTGNPNSQSFKIPAKVFAEMWAAMGAHKGVSSLVAHRGQQS